jgi:uncharacterized protein
MSAALASGLYLGDVMHRRLRPREHRLSYRIWSLLLDLDELASLDSRLRLFSVDRFNLVSFYRMDRGDRSGRDLRPQVEEAMRGAGLQPDGGAIRLLTMPRILGYAFNPLSVFFCFRRDGEIAAILWEVDNTFGERHGYLLPARRDGDGLVRQHCGKDFHVSPFMDMDLAYDFAVRPPDDLFSLVIDVSDGEGLLLRACHLARRAELSDAALLRQFLKIPLVTMKVVAGIHWEALKLWLKGVGLRRRPAPPPQAVSSRHSDRHGVGR